MALQKKNNKRRKFLIYTAGSLLTASGAIWYVKSKKPAIGFSVDQELLLNGQNLLNKIIAIDIHAHPGRSFVEGAKDIATKFKYYSLIGRFEDEAIEDMKAGKLTVASFSTVADYQLLDLGDKGLYSRREFKANEAWQSYQTQIATLKSLLKAKDVTSILVPNDIIKAKKENKIGIFMSAEGADFLQGNLANLDTCYNDGIRSITLMHYHVNQVGDIQTSVQQNKSLTPFGISLVKKMNDKGIIIDLAHAHKNTLRKALEVTEKPIMVSHTLIADKHLQHPRYLDLADAKRIAQAGGIIGIWPAGLHLQTLSDYIDQIFRHIDLIGVEHVAIGSDMDANYKPVFYNYRQLPIIAGALLKRGLNETEAAKVLGGNFMRLFEQVST
jgi:membrane dipeptidase